MEDDKDLVQQFINSDGTILNRTAFVEKCYVDCKVDDIGCSSKGYIKHEVKKELPDQEYEAVNIESFGEHRIENYAKMEVDTHYHEEIENAPEKVDSLQSKSQLTCCNLCEYTTSHPRNLETHFKRIHLKVKNHKFDQKDNLSDEIELERSQHKAIEEIDQSEIIPSDDGSEEIYVVRKKPIKCKNCQLRDLCLHQFECSCSDFSLKLNMCKHIQLVTKFIQNTEHPTNIGSTEDTQSSVIHKSNTENCDSINEQLSENRSLNSDLTDLREEIQASFSQKMNSISSIEDYELIAKTLASVNPKLMALRNNSLPS